MSILVDFEDIKWWFEDNWKVFLGILSVIAIIAFGAYIFYVEADRSGKLPDSYEEQIETLQQGSEVVKDTFSLLDQVDVSTVDGQVVYELYLYNKKPFIDSGDLENALRDYVKSLEIVEATNDREVRAVKFNLYDRKVKFDTGVNPDGVYYYGIPYVSLPEDEKNDVNSRYYSMSPVEVAYEYTSTYAPEKLDKDKYQLYGNYKHLRRVPGVEPLTDQEFEWFVKLDTYTTIGADSGSLYLEWELGAPRSSSVSRLFRQDVRSFRQRLTALGDESTVYDNNNFNVREMKRRLVINNPSFLWYAETGQVEENAIEARRLLVEKYPADYQKVVEDWVESLAEDQIKQMQQGQDPATSPKKEDESNLEDTESGEQNLEDEPESDEQESTDVKY